MAAACLSSRQWQGKGTKGPKRIIGQQRVSRILTTRQCSSQNGEIMYHPEELSAALPSTVVVNCVLSNPDKLCRVKLTSSKGRSPAPGHCDLTKSEPKMVANLNLFHIQPHAVFCGEKSTDHAETKVSTWIGIGKMPKLTGL